MQEELLTEERDAYGYTYDEMMPLSKKGALALFEYGAPIFLLYEDNTESEVFDRKQISEHDGIWDRSGRLGRNERSNFRSRNKRKPNAG